MNKNNLNFEFNLSVKVVFLLYVKYISFVKTAQ